MGSKMTWPTPLILKAKRLLQAVALLLLAIAIAGCSPAAGDGSEGSCIEELVLDCTPLYEPTFEHFFKETLTRSCAVAGGACHAAEGAQGGLSLDTPEKAYELLLGGDSPRVIPGDPACSLLVARLRDTNDSLVMPPGHPLSPEEQCAIIQWIANGAAP